MNPDEPFTILGAYADVRRVSLSDGPPKRAGRRLLLMTWAIRCGDPSKSKDIVLPELQKAYKRHLRADVHAVTKPYAAFSKSTQKKLGKMSPDSFIALDAYPISDPDEQSDQWQDALKGLLRVEQ